MDIIDKLKLLDSGYVDVEIRPLEEREGSGLQIEQFWQCGGAMDMTLFAGDFDEQIDAISQRFRELGGTGYSTMRIPVQCPHQRKIVFDFAAARLIPLEEEAEAKLAIAEIERLRARVAELEKRIDIYEDRLEIKAFWVDQECDDGLVRKVRWEVPPDERPGMLHNDAIATRDMEIEMLCDTVGQRRVRIAELEAHIAFLEGGPMPKLRHTFQDNASETALDELARLGQEIDAQLTPNAKTQAAMDDVQRLIDARDQRKP